MSTAAMYVSRCGGMMDGGQRTMYVSRHGAVAAGGLLFQCIETWRYEGMKANVRCRYCDVKVRAFGGQR